MIYRFRKKSNRRKGFTIKTNPQKYCAYDWGFLCLILKSDHLLHIPHEDQLLSGHDIFIRQIVELFDLFDWHIVFFTNLV